MNGLGRRLPSRDMCPRAIELEISSCLLDTMSFVDATPFFKITQWYIIVLLFLEVHSIHRLPVLAPHLMSKAMLHQQNYLLDTMSFVDAIPSFKITQWYVIVLLFLEAFSIHRLPVLAPHLMSKAMLLQQVLNAQVLPLDRLSESSMQDDGRRINNSERSEK